MLCKEQVEICSWYGISKSLLGISAAFRLERLKQEIFYKNMYHILHTNDAFYHLPSNESIKLRIQL